MFRLSADDLLVDSARMRAATRDGEVAAVGDSRRKFQCATFTGALPSPTFTRPTSSVNTLLVATLLGACALTCTEPA
jgi:hypothetical protein